MQKKDLDNSLKFLFTHTNKVKVLVYALFQGKDEPVLLDIQNEELPAIKKMFVESIETNIINKKDYKVLDISSADDRNKSFYHYDLEIPQELKNLEKITKEDTFQTFSFINDKLDMIDALLIAFTYNDNEVSLYKKLSSIEVIGRGGYILKKATQRFERFEDQMLRISPNFQIIRVNNDYIITKIETLERFFGFLEVIQKEAALSISSIEQMSIVVDIESFKDLVSDVSFARKLTKIAKDSPVIKKQISNDIIIKFSQSHPATKSLKFNDDKTKFNLNSKASKVLFLKILNDDLLTSELTKLHYDSLAKDGFEEELVPKV